MARINIFVFLGYILFLSNRFIYSDCTGTEPTNQSKKQISSQKFTLSQ